MRHLKQFLLCVLLIFIPNISLQFPIKIDKLIFNYNQVVNFQNKVTTSNMYVYSITIDILQSPTCNIGCINDQDWNHFSRKGCTLNFFNDNFEFQTVCWQKFRGWVTQSKYRPRFFDQVGYHTMSAFIENKHFSC